MTRRKTVLLIGLVVVATFIGYAVNLYRGFSRDMNARYGTTNTIGRVTDYVEAHEGRWPTNWDEIEPWPGAREFVVVKFDVDIDQLIAEPEAIKSVIVPAYGQYHEYHHGRFAEQLRQKLIEIRKAKTDKTLLPSGEGGRGAAG